MTLAETLVAEAEAAEGDQAIQVTDDMGNEHEYLPVSMGSSFVWLHTCPGIGMAHTIEREGVINRVRARDPDVRLLPESRSQFAEIREQ